MPLPPEPRPPPLGERGRIIRLVDPGERGCDVSVHSGHVPESGLTGIRVLEMERLLCASPEYLARRGTPTCLADLERHDCLAHRQAAGGVWHFRQGDRIIRQSINQWMLADCCMALWELARKGLAIMRASSWAACATTSRPAA